MAPLPQAESPMRQVAVLVALLALAACQSEPGSTSDQSGISSLPQFITGLPGYGPEFTTTGLQAASATPALSTSNNTGADVAARHAAQIGARGYQILEEGTAPGEPIEFKVSRVRCNAYRPSL